MQANTVLEALKQPLLAKDDDSASPNNDSMFILDSCDHPTHFSRPTANRLPLTTPTTTHIATDTKYPPRITEHCSWRLIGMYNSPSPVSNSSITHNLVPLHDLARTAGVVAFTPYNAYMFNTKQLSVKTIVRSTPFERGLYILIHSPKTAQVRSIHTLGAHRPLSIRPLNHTRHPPYSVPLKLLVYPSPN